MGNPLSGLKDVFRSVPILGNVLGLSTPEKIAADAQRRSLTQSGQQLAEGYQPYIDQYGQYAGMAGALPGLQQQAQAGTFTPSFDPSQMQDFQFNLEQDPGYQFTRDQGLDAIEAKLAARGLTGSTREMRDMSQYATGLASQYGQQQRQQQFNEYQQGIQNLLSGYGLAGQLGQQSYGQQMGLGGLGLEALGAQTELGTGLAGLQSGLTQQAGQVSADQRMAETAGIRNMLNEVAQAAGNAYAPGSMSGNEDFFGSGMANEGSFG